MCKKAQEQISLPINNPLWCFWTEFRQIGREKSLGGRSEEYDRDVKARLGTILKKTDVYMQFLAKRIRCQHKTGKSLTSSEAVHHLLQGQSADEKFVCQTKSCVGGSLKDYQRVEFPFATGAFSQMNHLLQDWAEMDGVIASNAPQWHLS